MAALPPIPAAEKSPDATTLRQGLLALRLELEAESRPERRAHLAFELARLAEWTGDLPAAARDALAAANATSGFTEALELLLRIAHARRSSTNLEKLLERSFLVAPDDAGKERAGLEWVALLLEKKDFDGARSVVDELARALPGSGAVALLRQALSAASEDFAGLEESSPARLEATSDPRVRALLLERQASSRPRPEEAIRELERVLTERPNWRVARRLIRLWLETGRAEEARELLAHLAQWLQEAQEDPSSAREREIPARSLSAGSLRELTLERAWAALEAKRWDEAEALLQGLHEEAPDSLFVSALFGSVRSEVNADGASRARTRLSTLDEQRRRESTSPEDRAGLGLLVAWLASTLELEPREDALEAARAWGTGAWGTPLIALGHQARAGDFEGAARTLLELGQGARGGFRAELLAAAALLLLPGDVSGAMRLFEQAREAGLEPRVVRRLLRVLAALTDNPGLLYAADRALLELEPGRQTLIWESLELGRRTSAEAWENALDRLPEDSFERVIAAAFVPPKSASTPRDEILGRLARSEALPPELRRALALVQVARDLSSPHVEAREAALSRLRALAEEHPEDRLVTSVFSELLLETDAVTGARALLRFAEHASPDERDEDRLRALLSFLRAGRAPEVLETLTAWGEPGETPLAAGERPLLDFLGKPAVVRALALEEKELAQGSTEAAFRVTRRELAASPGSRLEELARSVERAGAEDDARAAPAGAGWLTLLLAGGRELDELERVVSALPHDWLTDEEHELLRFSLHRQAPTERQLEAARRWLEAALALSKDHPSARDAAWTLLLLATTSGSTDVFIEAEQILAELEEEPLLEADALLRRSPEAPSVAASLTELALRHPARLELTWAALERSSHADPRLLEALVRGLVPEEASLSSDADPDAIAARLLVGFHQLTSGAGEEAFGTFTLLETLFPHDPSVLVGLRVAARAGGHAAEEARASVLLAKKCESDERAARLWERAGDLYSNELADLGRAEEAYRAALERAPASAHSYAQLYRLARAKKDRPRLLELVEARLALTDEPEAQVELLWDRARLAHKLDRRGAALGAAERLLTLAPQHPGALAVAAEAYLTDARPEQAAEALGALASLPLLDPEARELFGLHAVELLEEQGRSADAVSLLQELEDFGIPRAHLRTHLAHAAARAGAWAVAHRAFAELEEEPSEPERKLPHARMLLAIERDHLRAPDAALATARRVIALEPLDDDAVEVIVNGALPVEEKSRLLGPALERARVELAAAPLHKAPLRRLIERAKASGATRLLATGFGAAALSGSSTPEDEAIFERVRAELEGVPTAPLPPEAHELLVDPREDSALGRFARLLAPRVAELTEPSLESLGVTPLLRVDPFGDHPARREIATWAEFLGLGDFELYLGGDDPARIVALSREFPTIVLGRDVPLPLGARDRVRLAVSLWSVRRGADIFLKLPLAEAKLWMEAARLVLGAEEIPSGDDATTTRARALAALLSRETKEKLREEAAAATEALETFPLAARASAARLAVLLGGEPSILRQLPRVIPDDPEERRHFLGELVRFSLSEELAALRTQVGLP